MKIIARIAMRAGLALSLFAIAALGAAQGGFAEGTELRLLQWRSFVPRYDEWFDAYAQQWGADNDVAVHIDRVGLTDVISTLAAELAAGQGHSLIDAPTSPASFAESLQDLSDINQQAQARFGEPLAICQSAAYLPAVDLHYGFVNTYIPNMGAYDSALWAAAGYPAGPQTYDDLLAGGRAIFETTGIPLGIGMSGDPDSETAARAVIWSFGGRIQDAGERVVFDSPESIAAVEYLARLQNEAMTDEVFGWTPPSDNQALIAGDASFIFNPITAYRSLQQVDELAAANIGFSPALAGPAAAIGTVNTPTFVIPKHVQGDELAAAKQFILDHTAAYSDAAYHGELYNLPCYPAAVPELAGWLSDDPFGSLPADKLAVMAEFSGTAAALGYPGTSNPAIGQVLVESIISTAVARAALGELSAAEAVAQAHERIEGIFAAWRAQGLIGG